MTPDQINLAIAKYCGFTIGDWVPEMMAQGEKPLGESLPDYYHDLNAMHEAELAIAKLEPAYTDALRLITCDGHSVPLLPVVHATAAQRAEAFLRATGNWQE